MAVIWRESQPVPDSSSDSEEFLVVLLVVIMVSEFHNRDTNGLTQTASHIDLAVAKHRFNQLECILL